MSSICSPPKKIATQIYSTSTSRMASRPIFLLGLITKKNSPRSLSQTLTSFSGTGWARVMGHMPTSSAGLQDNGISTADFLERRMLTKFPRSRRFVALNPWSKNLHLSYNHFLI